MKYITKQVVIDDTEIDFPVYQNNISDTDNFTYIINHVIKIIDIQKLILHTIRISENIPHLLYNKNNTYDASGTYRYGDINGPIISEIKLTNFVYLYDINNLVIGRIKLIELSDDIYKPIVI
tara:strand:+ start:2115 stop:2480 length:366 start_codon:yes stop_codon:yes gene_type:complete